MTDFKCVFLDTAPLVYLLDGDTPYTAAMEHIVTYLHENDVKMATSVITAAEYLVVPYRQDKMDQARSFFSFVADAEIRILTIDVGIAEQSAKLRAQYPGVKGMDSLQLASASYADCDVFLTNDKRLCQCKEVNCVLIDDFRRLLEE